MNEDLKTLYEMCDIFSESLKDAKEKLRKSSGPVSVGDADYVDKLTHTLKSLETTIAMKEAKEEDEGGYSGRYMPRYGYAYNDGRSYADGTMLRGDSYGGMSNAGRRNAKRDSMGRYAREGGYSYADSIDSLLDEMRGMMDTMPEEKRREVQRFIDKMDRM